jgi:pectinesterase
LRIHQNDFKLYNVNVKNTCGKSCGQAVALSQYGSKNGFYGVGLYGYQDTLLLNFKSTQVFLRSYIEVSTLA